MCKILVQNFIIKDILKKKNVVHWISVRTIGMLTLYLIETPFYRFCKQSRDTDQAALIRAAWSESTLFAYGILLDITLH